MELIKLRTLGVAVLLVSSFSAYAAGNDDQYFNDGFYVGGTLGYLSQTDHGTAYGLSGGDDDFWDTQKPRDAAISLLGGYRWRLGDKWTTGLEMAYRYTSAHQAGLQRSSTLPVDTSVKSNAKSAVSFRGNLGYLLTERLQPYVTAGIIYQREQRRFRAPNWVGDRDSRWHQGWVAGIGVEYAYSAHLSSRIEYSYEKYQNEDITVPHWGEYYRHKLSAHALTVGMTYSF